MYAVDGNGEEQYHWSVWSCLSAEIVDAGRSFVLDNGAFYELDPDYDELIRHFVDGIDEWPVELPPCVAGIGEDEYNAQAANRSDSLLLMDRRLVTLQSRTSPIEVCDLYAREGALIHVKKQQGATSMSHLFSQGAVSADLLVASGDFRAGSLKRLKEAARHKAGGKGAKLLETFNLFGVDAISPSRHVVVFAIMDKRWDGRPLSDGISFFSRVNLRRTVEDVTRLGYGVATRRVRITLP